MSSLSVGTRKLVETIACSSTECGKNAWGGGCEQAWFSWSDFNNYGHFDRHSSNLDLITC